MSEIDPDEVGKMDAATFAAYVQETIDAGGRQIFAEFLETYDPETASESDVARGALLADIANVDRDRDRPLNEAEEAELDRLIAAQTPPFREMHTRLRVTNPRHVLVMLRGIAIAKASATYTEKPDIAE